MSGVGEASLVLGLISSIIAIFETAQKIYDAASDASGLPKKFRAAAERMPLVHHTLGLAEKNIKAEHVTADALKSAEPVLEQCKKHASALQEIFERSIPTKNDSKTARYRKAMGITLKGSTVKEHMEEIFKNMGLLAQYQVFVDAGVLSEIEAAWEELRNMPDDDERPQIKSEGSGPIAANYGSGTLNAYTNSGSGEQYNAQTMNFAERVYYLQGMGEGSPEARVKALKTGGYQTTQAAYERRRREMIDNTGSWLRESMAYQRWLEHQQPLLVFLGGPGTGKSFLATSTIKHIEERKKPDISMAFSFVEGQDEESQDVNKLLKNMAYDLQMSNPAFQKHILQVLEHDDGLFSPFSTWNKVYQAFWKDDMSNGRLVLIVDGLDETSTGSTEQQRILGELLQQSIDNKAIQVAIFGRFSLRQTLAIQQREAYVEVGASVIREEFLQYVQRGMKSSDRRKFVTDEKRQHWQRQIVEKTQGIFECARQALAVIDVQHMEAYQIDRFLEQPLDSLDTVTAVSLESIERSNALEPALLKSLLTWLCYCRKPLNLGEVYEIMRVQDGHDHERLLYNLRYGLRPIVECLMFDVGSSDGNEQAHAEIEDRPPEQWTQAELGLTMIGLAHEGIRDYLKARAPHDSRWIYSVDLAELKVANDCGRLLQLSQSCRLQGIFPWRLFYPCHYMMAHLRSIKLSNLSKEDLQHIKNGLEWLLWDTSGHEVLLTVAGMSWQGVLMAWFLGGDNATLLRSILTRSSDVVSSTTQRGGILDTFRAVFRPRRLKTIAEPTGEHEARESNKDAWLYDARYWMTNLFKPLRSTAVQIWLSHEVATFTKFRNESVLPRTMGCVFVLCTLCDLDRSGWDVHGQEASLLRSLPMKRIEASELRDLASLPGVQKTKQYHLNLGMTLQYYGHFSEAAEEYYKVLLTQEDCRIALLGLVQCSADMSDRASTRKWTERLQALEPDSAEVVEMSLALLKVERQTESVADLLSAIYKNDSSNDDNTVKYLMVLNQLGDHAKMLEVFMEQHRLAEPNKSYSRLIQLLMNFPPAFAWAGAAYSACRETSAAEQLHHAITSFVVRSTSPFIQLPWKKSVVRFKYAYVDKSLGDAIGQYKGLFDAVTALPELNPKMI